MDDALFPAEEPPTGDQTSVSPAPMTVEQRAAIREHFRELEITDAQRQFAVVKELTGTTIRSVSELDAATAHRLIHGLEQRARDSQKMRTGNAWDDREEDTWIDRL